MDEPQSDAGTAADQKTEGEPHAGEQQIAGGRRYVEDADQKAHSLLWSAFLGIKDRNVAGGDGPNRYLAYEVQEVADYLLAQWTTAHSERESRFLQGTAGDSLLRMALWAISPYFKGLKKEMELRKMFEDAFAFRSESLSEFGDDRPLMPSLPDIGIDHPTISTIASRRTMRARLESVVTLPLRVLQNTVYPWNWEACPFWTGLPKPEKLDGTLWTKKLEPCVRLPGGAWKHLDVPKERRVSLRVEVARSAFGSRIDYQGRELPNQGKWAELGLFEGFLSIEKVPARPQCCRVISEREVYFDDINHDRYSRQTLWYWLASELIVIADAGAEAYLG